MTLVPNDIVESAIQIIGTTGIEDVDIELRVGGLVSDKLTARRLIDWIPEAFGFVLVSHISSKIVLPTTFSTKARDGSWVSLKLTVEPIFTSALQIAQRMFHEGPRETFQNISRRSAMTNTVNRALNARARLDGATLSGPVLIGVPVEAYAAPPKSFWQRLFSR